MQMRTLGEDKEDPYRSFRRELIIQQSRETSSAKNRNIYAVKTTRSKDRYHPYDMSMSGSE